MAYNNIQTTEKGFQNLRKSYPSVKEALNELFINDFYVNNNRNIEMHFSKNGTYTNAFYFINDGDVFKQNNLTNALSFLGCESPMTAGNENGVGIKSSAAYLLQHNEDAVLFIFSKTNNERVSFGVINNKGQYSVNIEDLTKEQKMFLNNIDASFENGTATCVFNTSLHISEIESFLDDIPYLISTALTTRNVVAYIGQDRKPINFIDRHCLQFTNVKSHILENETFSYKGKIFLCDVILTNTKNLLCRKRNNDENKHYDFGCHFGYNDGYMPISQSNVSLIDYHEQPQHYDFRMSMIAKPNNEDEKYASVMDWRDFYSRLGNMSQQKVPNLKYEKNRFKAQMWKGYLEIIKKVKDVLNNVLEVNVADNNVSDDTISDINEKLKTDRYNKHVVNNIELKYKFADITDTVKFEQATNTISFTYRKTSPFVKKLLKGGRDGRNGVNDLNNAIKPIIDTFNVVFGMEQTSADMYRKIRVFVNQFNGHYLAEE
jgi:hypothetical protein